MKLGDPTYQLQFITKQKTLNPYIHATGKEKPVVQSVPLQKDS